LTGGKSACPGHEKKPTVNVRGGRVAHRSKKTREPTPSRTPGVKKGEKPVDRKKKEITPYQGSRHCTRKNGRGPRRKGEKKAIHRRPLKRKEAQSGKTGKKAGAYIPYPTGVSGGGGKKTVSPALFMRGNGMKGRI